MKYYIDHKNKKTRKSPTKILSGSLAVRPSRLGLLRGLEVVKHVQVVTLHASTIISCWLDNPFKGPLNTPIWSVRALPVRMGDGASSKSRFQEGSCAAQAEVQG